MASEGDSYMYIRRALSEIHYHGLDRTWWRKRFLTHIASRYFTGVGRPDSEPVTQKDWDNLIILDACRYDLFTEVFEESPLPGTLEKRRSVQSGTPGYLAETFAGKQFHDVVYVTGNPYVDTDLPHNTFHAVESVWKDDWDDNLQTIHPEAMAEATIEATEKYPNKRIISHFLQPHTPFVGEVTLGQRETFAIREKALGDDTARTRHRTPFELLDAGEVSRKQVWEAYRSNVEFAWPAVNRLLTELPGLTAVTSDHGNALGERAWPFPIRVYGHPLGVLIPALTDVPWLTNTNGPGKQIISEPPGNIDTEIDKKTTERLRTLGYAE